MGPVLLAGVAGDRPVPGRVVRGLVLGPVVEPATLSRRGGRPVRAARRRRLSDRRRGRVSGAAPARANIRGGPASVPRFVAPPVGWRGPAAIDWVRPRSEATRLREHRL